MSVLGLSKVDVLHNRREKLTKSRDSLLDAFKNTATKLQENNAELGTVEVEINELIDSLSKEKVDIEKTKARNEKAALNILKIIGEDE